MASQAPPTLTPANTNVALAGTAPASSSTPAVAAGSSTAHPSGIVPVLQYGQNDSRSLYTFLLHRNIVATVNLECKLDLKTIALHARNAEYNPKRFAAVIMR